MKNSLANDWSCSLTNSYVSVTPEFLFAGSIYKALRLKDEMP